ncbi:unnamed protein product [Ilex paraguariensis]|uniref:BHLH domain-containing protein n=1 Tax=Ilex paraguariensis TaxID=185542 RepID=A0ABC8SMB8_9AQUA
MHSVPSLYELGSGSNSANFLRGVLSSPEMMNIGNSILSSSSASDHVKAITANKSHSEAEKRRRRRINGHLATLRTLVPKATKVRTTIVKTSDKASLLAEVVRCVRELKKTTAELSLFDTDLESHNPSTNIARDNAFPSETDELKLFHYDGDTGTVKASLCCDDRPELISELTRALSSVQATVVRAEMATVGGRMRIVLWVRVPLAGDEGLGALRRALKVVVEKAALSPGSNQGLPGNKRPRLYHC